MNERRLPVAKDEHGSTARVCSPSGRSHAEISRLLLESITDYLNNPRDLRVIDRVDRAFVAEDKAD